MEARALTSRALTSSDRASVWSLHPEIQSTPFLRFKQFLAPGVFGDIADDQKAMFHRLRKKCDSYQGIAFTGC